MSKKREEDPKIERGDEKEEQVRLLMEVYFSNIQRHHGETFSEDGKKAKERSRDSWRKNIEQKLETYYQPLLRESKLSRDQFQFLTNALVEINRRERLQDLSHKLRVGDYGLPDIKMSAFSERLERFEELIEESKRAEVEFTIPGKKESDNLDFRLREVENWRKFFSALVNAKKSLDSCRSRGEDEGQIKYSEREFEKAREKFKDIDEIVKIEIEEFEREKASVSVATKEEIPKEESEKDLGEARKKAEEAFEEGGEKE